MGWQRKASSKVLRKKDIASPKQQKEITTLKVWFGFSDPILFLSLYYAMTDMVSLLLGKTCTVRIGQKEVGKGKSTISGMLARITRASFIILKNSQPLVCCTYIYIFATFGLLYRMMLVGRRRKQQKQGQTMPKSTLSHRSSSFFW